MDRSGITKLLNTVCVNYPQFRKHVEMPNGGISGIVIDEWMRVLGYLDYEEALDRLDIYMQSDDGKRMPKAMDLHNSKGQRREEAFHAPIQHRWHLEFRPWDKEHMHGRLLDQEDREYVHDPTYEDGYHYDSQGRICTIDGRVVFV